MDGKLKQIQELLEQAEKDLAQDPQLYKRKLFRYSLLGYGIILSITFILIGVIASSIWLAFSSSMFLLLLLKKKLFIPLFIMVWVLFKSVFIRWPKPEGVMIKREQSPQLFEIIDELQEKLNTPPIQQVIVTPEFNAAIVQTPRFLAFGFMHNTLIIGFELLVSLTLDEFKSVIAHELAHLSANHSKFHGWIYQARESWQKMMYNLDQHNGWTTAPIRKFFNWYSPRFSAYSFALARLNEYEADSVAGVQSSPEIAASALLKIPAYTTHIQKEHWTSFNRSIQDFPEPKTLPYAGLLAFMDDKKISTTEAESAINFAKKEVTNYHDTHPSLMDRLVALNAENIKFVPTEHSAAKLLFGDKINEVAAMLDTQWKESCLEDWKQEHLLIQKERELLSDLKSKQIAQLSKDELWNLARLKEKLEDDHQTIELYRVFHDFYPNDFDGQFALGQALLEQNDDTGLQYLEKASEKHELLEVSCKASYSYLLENERMEEARDWLERMYKLDDIYREASLERQSISSKDRLIPIDVPEAKLEHIVQQIKANKRVKNAWVAQKEVQYFSDSQVLVFALKSKRGFYVSDNLAEKIIESLDVGANVAVFALTKSNDSRLFKNVLSIGKQVI